MSKPIIVNLDVNANRASAVFAINLASLLKQAGAKVKIHDQGKNVPVMDILRPTVEGAEIIITSSGNNIL